MAPSPNCCKVILVSTSCGLVVILCVLLLNVNVDHPCKDYDFITSSESDSEGSISGLFLTTSYIRANLLDEGREKAFVGNWRGVPSFSGYLTVNENLTSHLFFWFFPAAASSQRNASQRAPVILYLQGGPGMSSLIGLFLETGPFTFLDETNTFQRRKHAWTQTHSVLYIDSPISTGFSFGNPEDYPLETDSVARDLYEALTQFFTIFNEYQQNEFYIAGTSYCGKYIPILGTLIHRKNQNNPKVLINLKGVAIGGGYFDAAIQDKYADFNYFMGFIDEQQKELCEKQEAKIEKLIQEKNFEAARNETLYLKVNLTSLISGWDNFLSGNGLEMEASPHFWNFHKFLEMDCVKAALHAGNRTYLSIGSISGIYSRKDYYRSTRPELEELLNAHYRVLIFASQFDMVVTHFGISNFLDTLEWARAGEYAGASRNIWKVNGTIAGYVKEIAGLTYVVFRNSGHMPCKDNSFWCYEMINRFTNGSSLLST